MNKKLALITTTVIALMISAFAYVLLREKPANTPTMDTEKTTSQPQPAPEQPSNNTFPGLYTAYSPDAVTAAKGTKILFFHAAWCPQCRTLDKEITAGPLPDNVTIFKVDYDSNQALRQKYGVQLQTTLVRIDDSGNMIEKFIAYDDPTLASLIKNLL